MAILALILVLLTSATGHIRNIYSRSVGQAKAFEAVRTGFDQVTRRLSAATLNAYLDYDNPTKPVSYIRISELHFASGPVKTLLNGVTLPGGTLPQWGDAAFFATPSGFSTDPSTSHLKTLLDATGYFVEYGDGRSERPAALGNRIPTRSRYRLVEVLEPTGELAIYKYDPRGTNPAKNAPAWQWFKDAVPAAGGQNIRLVAENIVGFYLFPQTADGTFVRDGATGIYDTRPAGALDANQPPSAHQLPQVMRVTMVAINEDSALRLAGTADGPESVMEQIFTGLFSEATTNLEVDEDVKKLEKRMAASRIDFRVLNSYVNLGEAKWKN